MEEQNHDNDLEKGKKDLSKLTRKIITNKSGHKQTVWVKNGEDPKKPKEKKEVDLSPKRRTLEEVNPKLHAKTKRREAGKGEEITLTKDEVSQMLTYGKIGFISAGVNPNNEADMKMSEGDIVKRYGYLKEDLVNKGYTFVRVAGRYEGHDEDTFMLMANDIDKADVMELGTKYNQDSVIYSEGNDNEMIYTTGDHKGQKYVGKGWEGMSEDAEDNYSKFTTPTGDLKMSLNFNWDKMVKGLRNLLEKAKKEYGECDLDELIAEHKRLIAVLKSSSKEDDKREAKTQEAELKKLMEAKKEMKKDMSTDIEKGGKKDLSKLTKKQIVDKDGKKRTVWVKMGEVAKHARERASEDVKSQAKMITSSKDWYAKHKDKYDTEATGNLLQKKMKGLVKNIKHEIHEYKEAARGIKNLVTGGEVTDYQKEAIYGVAKHAFLVAASTAITGGLAGTAGSIAQGLAGHWMEHSAIVAVGHALAFAKAEDEGEISDQEADHYLERMLMSMGNFAKQLGKEEEPQEKQA